MPDVVFAIGDYPRLNAAEARRLAAVLRDHAKITTATLVAEILDMADGQRTSPVRLDLARLYLLTKAVEDRRSRQTPGLAELRIQLFMEHTRRAQSNESP